MCRPRPTLEISLRKTKKGPTMGRRLSLYVSLEIRVKNNLIENRPR